MAFCVRDIDDHSVGWSDIKRPGSVTYFMMLGLAH